LQAASSLDVFPAGRNQSKLACDHLGENLRAELSPMKTTITAPTARYAPTPANAPAPLFGEGGIPFLNLAN